MNKYDKIANGGGMGERGKILNGGRNGGLLGEVLRAIGGGSESPEMLNEACVKMCSNERISANILVAKLYR